MQNGSSEITSLTGLRGVAALVVAASHFSPLPAEVFVDVFFALSGFVISLVYLPRPGQSVDWRAYAAARLARIYPLHLLTAAAAGVLICLGVAWHTPAHHFPVAQIVRELTLTMTFMSDIRVSPWNGPAWSIAVEWWAYFTLFPLLVYVGGRIPRALAASLYLLAAAALVAALGRATPEETLQNHLALARAFVGFAGGWVAYRFYAETEARLPGRVVDALAGGVFVLAFAGPLVLKLNPYLCVPLLPLLVFGLAGPRSIAADILSTRPLIYLGVISYSIYLLHFVIYLVIVGAEQSLGFTLTWPARMALGLGATAVLAPLTYRYWELPMRDHVRLWLKPRQPAMAAE